MNCLHNLKNISQNPSSFSILSPNWKVPGIFICPVFQSSFSFSFLAILPAIQTPEPHWLGKRCVHQSFAQWKKSCFLVYLQDSSETGLTLFWINMPGTTSKRFMSWACQSSPPPLSSIFSSPSYCMLTFLQAKSTLLSHFSATPPFSKPPFPI